MSDDDQNGKLKLNIWLVVQQKSTGFELKRFKRRTQTFAFKYDKNRTTIYTSIHWQLFFKIYLKQYLKHS